MKPLNSHKLLNFSCYGILEMLFVPWACAGYHNSKAWLSSYLSILLTSQAPPFPLFQNILIVGPYGSGWFIKVREMALTESSFTEKTVYLLFSASCTWFCTLGFLFHMVPLTACISFLFVVKSSRVFFVFYFLSKIKRKPPNNPTCATEVDKQKRTERD